MSVPIFDSNDPFPHLELEKLSLAELQNHSEQADAWLGLETQSTEDSIEKVRLTPQERSDRWIDLPVQTLLTPYIELRSILECVEIREGDTIVDLGAGYGRMGFVIGEMYPHVQFHGFELVNERVAQGRRVIETRGYKNVRLDQADLCSPIFTIPDADFYFIYDFGNRESIEIVLEKLKRMALRRPIHVIGRGGRVRDLIEKENYWLSKVVEPRHYPRFSIYRSSNA